MSTLHFLHQGGSQERLLVSCPVLTSILPSCVRSGKHYVLSWSIPDAFGGMTSALLHRSRAFVRLAGRPVEILTFDDRLDYPELVERLRASGDLVDGMRVLNVWEWLREHDEELAPPGASVQGHEPLEPARGLCEGSRDGVVLVRQQQADPGGEVLATDRFRPDGTLLMTDRRDPDTRGRSLVLYDRRGEPVRRWESVWALYRHWLDRVIGAQESFVIVDSKTVARFARTYRRANVVMMHVLHGSHRSADGSQLSATRLTVLEHLDDFDAVIVLTSRQREDLLRDLGPHDNIAVIPNGFDGSGPSRASSGRRRGRGVMLASLIVRKRVSHAIKALARASDDADLTLDVFGEGERRPLLEKTIRSLGVQDRVRLRGHADDARAAFGSADFMLLTSKAEGLPLALIEAMAAGCIPIAYDIPYGPSDVIQDGRNGFLIPPGDIGSMAQRIAELQRMPQQAVSAMRRRARESASRFDDRSVMRAWGREMRRARRRKRRASGPGPRRIRRLAGRIKRRLHRLAERALVSDP